LSIGFAALALGLANRKPFRRKLLQDGIDLSVAFAPEVREEAADELLDVVPGAGPECKKSEDSEFALVRLQGSTPPKIDRN